MEGLRLHLLVSVFLSPTGIGSFRYNIRSLRPGRDPFFRIGRFLTGLQTLTALDFESVRIHFSTDPKWASFRPQIARSTTLLMPQAEICGERLYRAREWAVAAQNYNRSDVVLLHANDDHALLGESSAREMKSLALALQSDANVPMASITHFPEVAASIAGNTNPPLDGAGFREHRTTRGLGTTLVRGDFFQTWFAEGTFAGEEVVVRPDNPSGRSVRFSPSISLVPNREVMRHMDGYSHVFMQRPLAPLRNLVVFTPAQHSEPFQVVATAWTARLWPSRIFGFNGSGADVHLTDVTSHSPSFWEIVRVQIAVFQLYWGIRVLPDNFRWVIPERRRFARMVSICLALCTFPIFRNIPELFLHPFVGKVIKVAESRLNEGRTMAWLRRLNTHGVGRTTLLFLRMIQKKFLGAVTTYGVGRTTLLFLRMIQRSFLGHITKANL